MDTLALLLHPVRLRIVQAMAGGRSQTTTDLCARLADVPRTTVYRQVALLAEAGVLTIADEQRVRGAVERHYVLRLEQPTSETDAIGALSIEDHRRAFAASIATLLAEFDAYLARDEADPTADSVGYRQGTLWLSPDELSEMIDALVDVLVSRTGNEPTQARRPHRLSVILFPTGDPRGP